ncbi:pimeloyl-ACP methyl ester carboxylesterase [Parvibaculum indicum]|uniref:alpha/beta fold hydrolase n=1 Tax=Parvibaculum indicum TaxID=562969 RepID=UPI001421B161|nr:alpha/beta hydrolase [Parvibaculum indicum]NIJ43324.1 pimeloyl-ACP methyl ester carboxylesterase [Parvibaculum indicum]
MVKRFVWGIAGLVLAALVVIAIAAVRFDIPRDELVAEYAQPPSRFIELPGGADAHVRVQGDEAGPVLLLLHGSNASLQTWEPWAAQLGDSYRIVTMDLPGHGLTGAVPGDDYSRKGMADFVDEVMVKLGMDRFAIGGNSMGGGVAAQYTVDHPDKVSALILVDSAGIPRRHSEDEKAPLAFQLASSSIGRVVMRWVTPRALVEEGVKSVFADPSKVTPAMVDRYYDLTLYDGNRRATALRFAGFKPDDDSLAVRLPEIEVPVLVMWGAQDHLIPVSVAAAFKKRIPQAQIVTYPDAGHVPMEEVPEKSAADVRGFLSFALGGTAKPALPDAP